MKYKVKFPLTHDMSPIDYVVQDKPTESKEEEALWYYNKSREHDGLPPLTKLPTGTKFSAIYSENMKPSDLAKKIINEDTWGNNPSAAGSMSPGTMPTTTSAPAPTGRNMDISNLFKNFKTELEKQEDAAIKKLSDQLKKSFLKKAVKIKASKGSVGQIEKEYNVNVDDIDVRYMKDKYFIVFSGKEGKEEQASEYYLDDSVVNVDDAAQSISTTGRTGGMAAPSMSDTSKKNILPQK